MFRSPSKSVLFVAVALLLQFLIRAHAPAVQDGYLDEGFHLKRAASVYDFENHPARESHGKLLLYFWLGLFQPEPPIALPVGRLSIALYSLITGGAIYAVGRRLYGPPTGLAALAVYTVLPLAFFYERMAMADPIAAGLSTLIVWRSLIFARRPSDREAALIGVLLGLATLAKLSMGLTPLIPVAAALLFYRWDGVREGAIRWLNTYAPPLSLAALVMGLVWVPVAIPALIASTTGEPFNLVDSFNIEPDEDNPRTPQKYLDEFLPLAYEMVSPALLGVTALAALYHILPGRPPREIRRGLMLVVWIAAVALILPYVVGRLITMRYFMPAAPPIAVILGRLITGLPDRRSRWARLVLGGAVIAGAVVWLVTFALPFLRADWTDPNTLPFERGKTNFTEYISGFLTADEAVQSAVEVVEQIEPRDTPVYANWWLCHLMYLSSERPITCLDYEEPLASLRARLEAELPPGGTAFLALTQYGNFFERIEGLCFEQQADFDRVRIRIRENWHVRVYRLWWCEG